MVFQCGDPSFGNKRTVETWWDDLEGDAFAAEDLAESCGTFVVQHVEFGREAARGEEIVKNKEGTD